MKLLDGMFGEVFVIYNFVNDGFEGGGLIDVGFGNFVGYLDGFYCDMDDYDILCDFGE